MLASEATFTMQAGWGQFTIEAGQLFNCTLEPAMHCTAHGGLLDDEAEPSTQVIPPYSKAPKQSDTGSEEQ
jgi:hypothetical protein